MAQSCYRLTAWTLLQCSSCLLSHTCCSLHFLMCANPLQIVPTRQTRRAAGKAPAGRGAGAAKGAAGASSSAPAEPLAPVSADDLLPRTDISALIRPDLLDSLKDAQVHRPLPACMSVILCSQMFWACIACRRSMLNAQELENSRVTDAGKCAAVSGTAWHHLCPKSHMIKQAGTLVKLCAEMHQSESMQSKPV